MILIETIIFEWQLAKCKEELDEALADLYTCCEFVEKALVHASDTEVILVEKQVSDKLDKLVHLEVDEHLPETDYLHFEPGM